MIWTGAALVVVLMSWRWSALLMSTLGVDIVCASGINPKREQMVLTLSLSIVIAVAIKVVGVLLIASLLIILAAAARPLSRTPEDLVLVTTVIACVATLVGCARRGYWIRLRDPR